MRWGAESNLRRIMGYRSSSINGMTELLRADLCRSGLHRRSAPLPDVRLDASCWNNSPSPKQLAAQEAFAARGMEVQALVIAEDRPFVCGPCGLRYATADEAHDCCEGAMADQFNIGQSALPPGKLLALEKLFADGYSMTAATTALHLPDYRVRPHWNLLRDALMEREGLTAVIEYHHWRRNRLKERGVWYQNASGQFTKKGSAE